MFGSPDRFPENPNRLAYAREIGSRLTDDFFRYCLDNDFAQGYSIGWVTSVIPRIELNLEPSEVLPDGTITEVRRIYVTGLVKGATEKQILAMASAVPSKRIQNLVIETEKEDGIEYRSIYFEIPRPHTGPVVRNALLDFTSLLEEAGIDCDLPVMFDAEAAVDEDFVSGADFSSEGEIAEWEEREAIPDPDLTQARQALNRIMYGLDK